jgi:hypothetical protein
MVSNFSRYALSKTEAWWVILFIWIQLFQRSYFPLEFSDKWRLEIPLKMMNWWLEAFALEFLTVDSGLLLPSCWRLTRGIKLSSWLLADSRLSLSSRWTASLRWCQTWGLGFDLALWTRSGLRRPRRSCPVSVRVSHFWQHGPEVDEQLFGFTGASRDQVDQLPAGVVPFVTSLAGARSSVSP